MTERDRGVRATELAHLIAIMAVNVALEEIF